MLSPSIPKVLVVVLKAKIYVLKIKTCILDLIIEGPERNWRNIET